MRALALDAPWTKEDEIFSAPRKAPLLSLSRYFGHEIFCCWSMDVTNDLSALMSEYEAANELTRTRIAEVVAKRHRCDGECQILVGGVQDMSRDKEGAADELSTLEGKLQVATAAKEAFDDEYKKSCSLLTEAFAEERVLLEARADDDERRLSEIDSCNSRIRWANNYPQDSGLQGTDMVGKGAASAAQLGQLGLSVPEVKEVLDKVRWLEVGDAPHILRSKVQWLEAFGLSQHEIAKVVRSHPFFLRYSIENLDSHVAYFRGIGLSDKGIRRLVAVSPRALGLSVEMNLKPTVAWLKGHGLEDSEIARVVSRTPQLLMCSIDNNLQATVDWLKDKGVPDDRMRPLISSFPQLLCLSIDNKLEDMVAWLESQGCTVEEVTAIVRGYPGLFRYKIQGNLDVKWRYLTDKIGMTRQQIVEWPRVLSYSLDTRIGPRWSYVEARHPELRGSWRANTILTPTDAVFADRVAKGSLAEYTAFRARWSRGGGRLEGGGG